MYLNQKKIDKKGRKSPQICIKYNKRGTFGERKRERQKEREKERELTNNK